MQMDPPLQGYAKRFFNLYSRMLNMLITAPTGSISVFPQIESFLHFLPWWLTTKWGEHPRIVGKTWQKICLRAPCKVGSMESHQFGRCSPPQCMVFKKHAERFYAFNLVRGMVQKAVETTEFLSWHKH